MNNSLQELKQIIKDHIIDGKLDEFGVLSLCFFSISLTFAICKDKETLRLFLEAYHGNK